MVVIPSVVAYLILTRLIVESGDLILILVFPALGRENLGGGVEQYWSNWNNRCRDGDEPISIRKFLSVTGVDLMDYYNYTKEISMWILLPTH